jgi:hypothetical protein
MNCPHCGGHIGAGLLSAIEHEVFDDAERRIVVDGARIRLIPSEWRTLTALRERYRRMVPLNYLAEVAARDPLDGGNIIAVRVRVCVLRKQLQRTPFRIVGYHDEGYGLFPVEETFEAVTARRHVRTRLRPIVGAASLIEERV